MTQTSRGARRRSRLRAAAVVAAVLAAGACAPTSSSSSSRCVNNSVTLNCSYNTTTLTAGGEQRKVLWQVPRGTAPDGGWPVAILFQGTGATPSLTWNASPLEPFGAYAQTQVVERLLNHGFAVLTPATHLGGFTFWDTNNPLAADYYSSNDHDLMLKLFEEIDAGRFGSVDSQRLFATGVSSGGYMTSRMAVSYPGKFKALAIAAGSYATCAGILCSVGPIPPDHPPTLFLHGLLDPVVPIVTMEAYESRLRSEGIPTRKVVESTALHRWIAASPGEVVAWFERYDT